MKILLIGSLVYILEMRIGGYFFHLRCPQTPSRHELVCSGSSSEEKLALLGLKDFVLLGRKAYSPVCSEVAYYRSSPSTVIT